MKGDEKEKEKNREKRNKKEKKIIKDKSKCKRKKRRPTPSSSRIMVPFQIIRGKRENKHSAQNSSTSLEFHMGEGGGEISAYPLFSFSFYVHETSGGCRGSLLSNVV